MKNRNVPLSLIVLLTMLAAASAVRAADLQAKTIDGQVIQGEYLGTENDIVRIKTVYGTVSIPSKSIVTLLAVSLPEQPGGGAPGDAPAGPPPELLVFKEPKDVNLASWLAARMPKIPDAGIQIRTELLRLVRNFGGISEPLRQRTIRQLSILGYVAYPYIEASYTSPVDLDDKVEMLQAASGPHRPYSAHLFAPVHANALVEVMRTVNQPPKLPDDYITQHPERNSSVQKVRALARDVRTIENYASISGGPFNALFLLNTYKARYGGESDPLLKDVAADTQRLAATATDWTNKDTGWTPADRVRMIEMAFPLYFKDNDDLRGIAAEFLKKLLPEKHPKWEAPQPEWFEWWGAHKMSLMK